MYTRNNSDKTAGIQLAKDTVDDATLENLKKILNAKEALIKKAVGATTLAIAVTDEEVSFPWFERELSEEEQAAYFQLIRKLVEMAKDAKRVARKTKAVENEKYAFRCFLLRLGFIGPEYKRDRKILLKNLDGSSAYRDGRPDSEENVDTEKE